MTPKRTMRDNDRSAPEMSVVIVTPDCYETIWRAVGYLRAQTVRDRLEIAVVAPSVKALELDETELAEFFGFQVVEVGDVKSVGRAWAAGVRQASAPIVIYAEEHCYPEPGWAEALIRAHRGDWVAVGPVIGNANPGSVISQANFLIAYGRWAEPAVAGEIDDVPSHNTAYKRSVLLAYGSQLDGMLEVEGIFHRDLRARGYRFYHEPAAVTHHINFTVLSSLVRAEFHYGRLFGAARARAWSLLRRISLIILGPLIPVIRLRRVLQDVRRTGAGGVHQGGLLSVMIVGLTSWAVGEVYGCTFGAGKAAQGKWNLEFHRDQHLADRDRQAGADR